MGKGRRYRYRYYKKKGRWSANIRNITENISVVGNTSFYWPVKLCENPSQADTTVSQQYTVKNVELSYEIETGAVDSTVIENLCVYIMFVPQGMTVTETYPNLHPEYIMAYRYLGSPNIETNEEGFAVNSGRLPSRIKTRLSRRLNTGDSIQFLVVGISNAVGTRNCIIRGIVRWWTKAN